MNPYRTTLVMIQTMRQLNINTPAQQAGLLLILDKPGVSYSKLQSFLKLSKDSVGGLIRELKAKEMIYSERKKTGRVRPCKYFPTLKASRELGLEVKS